jgi:hypothetical protein
MKEFIAKYQKAIVGTGAVAVLVVCYFQQKELNKLRKAETEIVSPETGDLIKVGNKDLVNMVYEYSNKSDSLYDELFIEKTTNGRYELTFEHLKEVNPKLGKEMEDWMAHETE